MIMRQVRADDSCDKDTDTDTDPCKVARKGVPCEGHQMVTSVEQAQGDLDERHDI